MKVGCLQFSPVVGDVENNLSRADSVLLKSTESCDLDLLVLPEMSFTGYNFASRSAIQPYLEPSTSGISALWARTAALRHDCHVAVGYPEKVDASDLSEARMGFYNSVMMITREGETVANYKKTHLFDTDRNWAMPGHGFFADWVPGLGRVAIGICMDLNPRDFTAPWEDFEFANHVLRSGASVAIISMAWVTGSDAHTWSQTPHEPDMDSLSYWIARLEPLIRAETDYEILVVISNRVGVEGDMVFAGTSAVLGFRGGEVVLYNLLGRGEKGLLIVDTEKPPMGKLVYRPEQVSSTTMSEDELPGLIPSSILSPQSQGVPPFCPSETSLLHSTQQDSSGDQSSETDFQSPSLLAKDPIKLGVVPEQDESTAETGDEESALIAEWQRRMKSERATSDKVRNGNPDPPRVNTPKKGVHRRGASLSTGFHAIPKPGSPSPAGRLTPRSPFAGSAQHTRHQSLDAAMEKATTRKTPSPPTEKPIPLARATYTPPTLFAQVGTPPVIPKKKTALPKLTVTTDPDVLYQMEENLFNQEAHPYAMSAHPNDVVHSAIDRDYPATATANVNPNAQPFRADWRKMEQAVADPVPAVTAASSFSASQSNLAPHQTPEKPALIPQATPVRRKPKLSIATSKVSAWKRTDGAPPRGLQSAVDRPAPMWPGLSNKPAEQVAQTPIVARTDKEAFWRTAVMPQTANTEAFNLASISHTLGEAAMMSDTPEEPDDTTEIESWYQSTTNDVKPVEPKRNTLQVGSANASKRTLGADQTPIARTAPWSAIPGGGVLKPWEGDSRKVKGRERDASGLFSPSTERVPQSAIERPTDGFGSTSFLRPQSLKPQKKAPKARAPSRERTKTPQSAAPRFRSQTPQYGYPQEPSMEAAMAQIDNMYPPIPSPSLYSSQASSTQYTRSVASSTNSVLSAAQMRMHRPYETLRSAEAMAEPVNWVDRWMPPPGEVPYMDSAASGMQQTTFYPKKEATGRPGLNLLVPAFSNSTETLPTPGTAFPKTPADNNLASTLNARRHPGGRIGDDTGSESGWKRKEKERVRPMILGGSHSVVI